MLPHETRLVYLAKILMKLHGCFLICFMHSNPEWHHRGWDTSIAALSAFTACPTYPRIPYTPAGNQTHLYFMFIGCACLMKWHLWNHLGQVLLHKNCPIKKMHAVCMCPFVFHVFSRVFCSRLSQSIRTITCYLCLCNNSDLSWPSIAIYYSTTRSFCMTTVMPCVNTHTTCVHTNRSAPHTPGKS